MSERVVLYSVVVLFSVDVMNSASAVAMETTVCCLECIFPRYTIPLHRQAILFLVTLFIVFPSFSLNTTSFTSLLSRDVVN